MNLLAKLPPKVRTALYVVGTVGGLGWAAYETAHEDWRTAIPIFFGSLVTGTALTHRPTK